MNTLSKQQEQNYNYLTKNNYTLIDDISNFSIKNGYEQMKMKCPNGHEMSTNINTLNTNRFNNRLPVCKLCKSSKLQEKAYENSFYNVIVPKTRIECKDCKKIYHYSCLNKKCFCQLGSKRKEQLLYEHLYKRYENLFNYSREFTIQCNVNKKYDLCLSNEESIILFEVDDKQHFYKSSNNYKKDIKFTEYAFNIEENKLENKRIKLIRINDSLLTKNNMNRIIDIIDDSIKLNVSKEFCVIGNNYDHLVELFDNEESDVTITIKDIEKIRIKLI